MATRAQGCLDRLNLEGKEIDLAGPTARRRGARSTSRRYQGKAVVVYYWASWNDLAAERLHQDQAGHEGIRRQGELVGVNLDTKAGRGRSTFLKTNRSTGTHLFMPGGLESPLAVAVRHHGSLPVMFLVGPDGKVVSRHVPRRRRWTMS